MIYDYESVEDLGEGFKIIQNPNAFKYGTDAVLLSDFAAIKPSDTVMDLCTGSGIIPLLLLQKYKCKSISALEIQDNMFDMAKRSIALNGLEDVVNVVHGDLRDIKSMYPANSFSVVTCNPPYMKDLTGKKNKLDTKTIARHEIMCTIDDVTACSAYLLGSGGRLYMVHRAERLVDVFCSMRNARLEPKRLKIIQHSEKPGLLLIEAQKDRRPGLKIYGG